MRANNNLLENKWNNTSIRKKLMLVFFLPITLILIMNIYMYVSVNSMIARIDAIYVSNVQLSNLSDSLTTLQNSVKEYLENKGSGALSDYYKNEQNYRDTLDVIKDSKMGGSRGIMQDNIINQSNAYLELVDEIIQAKRGRNVEKYRANFETSELVFSDIQACVYSLNSEQFKSNTYNYYSLLSSLKYMEMVSIVILLFVSIINILILFVLTRSMTRPLIMLSQAANEVASGNFDIEIDGGSGNDEIGIVAGAFSQMVASIQRYVEEIRESMHRESALKELELTMENRMKEVELRNLQAQINPHFLFNTLNAGAQLAMMEDADKTTEFIQNMADFFRYNIKKINMDSTLAEEITLVDKYIYILNVRFTGEINYSKEIDESCGQVRVPSMILQPIVENAVNHGIRNIDWEGHIHLAVKRVADQVHIIISDNGVGMSAENIDKIMNGHVGDIEAPDMSDSNGVGLGNVIERLQLYTGMTNVGDVLDVLSEGEGKGTMFTIKVPIEGGN